MPSLYPSWPLPPKLRHMSPEKLWKGSWLGPWPAKVVCGQLGLWWNVWPLLTGRKVSADEVHTWYDGTPDPALDPERNGSGWLPEAP